MQSALSFEIEATCPWSGARAGRMTTRHGVVETPVFMPVGTTGTLKGMTFEQVEQTKAEIILANSYHLYLRPGHELIEKAGGIHNFIGWQKPLLTDSGGFQVFSLVALRKIAEEGVHFKDHRGGAEHFIGPEKSMAIQNALGADIIMAFDDCVKNPATHDQARHAMERTHRWLEKCYDFHARNGEQALFGIVQGSSYTDLREISAQHVTSVDLPGYAIGGVAVGEDRCIDAARDQRDGATGGEQRPTVEVEVAGKIDGVYASAGGIVGAEIDGVAGAGGFARPGSTAAQRGGERHGPKMHAVFVEDLKGDNGREDDLVG